MSAWTAAFWIWIALDVGIALGWMLRTALPSDRPQEYSSPTRSRRN